MRCSRPIGIVPHVRFADLDAREIVFALADQDAESLGHVLYDWYNVKGPITLVDQGGLDIGCLDESPSSADLSGQLNGELSLIRGPR